MINCFLARAIFKSGLSSVNSIIVVICPLTRTFSKIWQGRIWAVILLGAELYLGIFSQVWLKSISMMVMRRSRDSKMVADWLGERRVFLFFPPTKARKSESGVMPIKLVARAELQVSKTARSNSLRGRLRAAKPPLLSVKWL